MSVERRAWTIARLLMLLLVLVSLRAAYWQLWRGMVLQPVVLDPIAAQREYARLRGEPTPAPGEEASAGMQENLVALPQPVIQRTVQMLSNIQRGAIFDNQGRVLAADVGTPGDFTRIYNEISLAHVLGYSSALRTGVNGLEASYNEELLGLNRPDTEIDRMLHRPILGSNLVLTIDLEIQQAAAGALGGRPGSVVVLDGKTGAVLAMTSSPVYDPNQILDPNYMAALPQGALINRSTTALFTPGSTWKTVSLIAALDTGQVNGRTVFDFGEPRTDSQGRSYYVYEVDGGVIPDPNHKENRLGLDMSYAYSANAAFAKIGDDMDPDVMIEYARRMGFSDEDYTRRFPLELPVLIPQLAADVESIHTNNLLRAATAIGQGELLTTPINMAMVVLAVLNDGQIPVPYLVESIRDPEGGVIRTQPNKHIVRGIMSRRTAQQVKEIMVTSVEKGYASSGAVPGAVVGGKTGTAQLGGNLAPHAWYIGFAEKDGKSVIIAVVVENGGEGSRVATPIFAQVAAVALGQ